MNIKDASERCLSLVYVCHSYWTQRWSVK